MLNKSRLAVVACGCLCLVSLVGCGSTEVAVVEFSYAVDATRGLPEGMRTIMIVPAKLGPSTDEQWSDMCITIMQSLVNESKNSFGTDIEVTDRRDTQILLVPHSASATWACSKLTALRRLSFLPMPRSWR